MRPLEGMAGSRSSVGKPQVVFVSKGIFSVGYSGPFQSPLTDPALSRRDRFSLVCPFTTKVSVATINPGKSGLTTAAGRATALNRYLLHYHEQRPHQGRGNRPLTDLAQVQPPPQISIADFQASQVGCVSSNNGTIRHYELAA